MSLPYNYLLIRHGQSEQNKLFGHYYKKEIDFLLQEVNHKDKELHESTYRLTSKGVDQAQIAGEWVRSNILFDQDRYYVSPHVRAMETAGHLSLNGNWRVSDLLRERDWGEQSGLDENYEEKISESSLKLREQHSWLWKPTGGESLATGVRTRVELVMDSLYRKPHPTQNVIAVTHGEFIRATRFVIERMTPAQFNLESATPDRGLLPNCGILHYTRQNPEDPGDIRPHYTWKQVICPWDSSLSENDGKWVKITDTRYSDADLLEYANSFNHIFTTE